MTNLNEKERNNEVVETKSRAPIIIGIVAAVVAIIVIVVLVIALGGKDSDDKSQPNKKDDYNISAVDPTKEPEVTTEPTSTPEATVEPTPEATEESTPEPTEEPVLYEGIDMESDLPGEEWIETFVGIIEEPKIVVFSDTTGRKEIVEEKSTVIINPDEDVIAVYLPEGYVYAGRVAGIKGSGTILGREHSMIFFLDSERTREKEYEVAAIFVNHNNEEIALKFMIQSE